MNRLESAFLGCIVGVALGGAIIYVHDKRHHPTDTSSDSSGFDSPSAASSSCASQSDLDDCDSDLDDCKTKLSRIKSCVEEASELSEAQDCD